MKKTIVSVFCFLLTLSCFQQAVFSQTEKPELLNAFPNLSFNSPVFLTSAQDGSDRIFVVEQSGLIKVFQNDPQTSEVQTFLDVKDQIATGSEMGLLGLAFHPNFANNGLFYVDYTATTNGINRTVIAEFSANGNAVDLNSQRIILEITQFAINHNGGMLAFGLEGYLYIAMGDGGGGSDPQNNAQNTSTLLGAILRIDIDNKEGNLQYAIPADNPFANSMGAEAKEIFAYGLRNPWRFSIDSKTGGIWAGDVGQNRREEIDLIVNGGNYGWPLMEGFDCFDQNNPNNPPSNCDQSGLQLPITDYTHSFGRSITGGYVYRGSLRPELEGAYIYADYVNGVIALLRYEDNTIVADSLLLQTNFNIPSFGTDESNELYILAATGDIYRFNEAKTTRVGNQSQTPSNFSLEQNYPNPFNPQTTIKYTLRKTASVQLSIYNTLGQQVRMLLHGAQPSGDYSLTWDGKDNKGALVSSGIYFYKLKAAETVLTRKMVFAR